MTTAATTETVNRRRTRKAGNGLDVTKPKTTRKASDKQEQSGSLGLSDALEKSKNHLSGSATGQTDDKQGSGTSGKDEGAPATFPNRRTARQQEEGVAEELDDSEAHGDIEQGDGGTQIISQADDDTQNDSQGDGSEGELRLGTLQVLVTYGEAVTRRGGRGPEGEMWPFEALPLSEKKDGVVKGPYFFIPEDAYPAQVIASGRKRMRGQPVSYITRSVKGDKPGVRVWKIKGAGRRTVLDRAD